MSEVMARTLAMGDTTAKDRVQNAYGYGLFTGGLGVHYGARKIGAMVIPISGGNTKRQLQIMKDFGTTVLCCTPSYSLHIAEAGKEEKIDFRNCPSGRACFGAESWSENMRKEIEEKLHSRPSISTALPKSSVPAWHPNANGRNCSMCSRTIFIPEIINPETGQRLPDGEKGELVFTTLTKEGTPVIQVPHARHHLPR